MNTRSGRGFNPYFIGLVWLIELLVVNVSIQAAQPVSVPDASQPAASGGGGDSGAPVITPNGRYVLFASTAGNLLLTSNNLPIAPTGIPTLNVYLRDRTNGTTVLVSVNQAGTGGGNGDSVPVGISTNGRYAAFESGASDLVTGDTNATRDIFVRDTSLGLTMLASVSTNGNAGNGESRSAVMTPDGRYVAFVSAASNLVANDSNGIADIFVRDLQAGTTLLASTGAMAVSGSSSSESPVLTPDGRYVAFYSTATNLVAGVTNSQDLYVRDLTGATTAWASAAALPLANSILNASNVLCYNHAISTNGNYLAYEAGPTSNGIPFSPGLILRYHLDTGTSDLIHTNAATAASTGGLETHNLDITADGQRIVFVASTNGTSGATTCILLWDSTSGTSSLVSGALDGSVTPGTTCDWPAIDASGQFVAFNSTATNLTTNVLAGACHLYLRDLNAGTTTLLDADTNGVGSSIAPLTAPCLSGNARLVAFECNDGTLVPNDRNRNSDVVVRDRLTGAIELISACHATLPSQTPNGPSLLATGCSSSDGNQIAFASDADNLTANDSNGARDVFVRDRTNAVNTLVSADTNGLAGDGISFEPAMSSDGCYVAFTSYADNLADGDTNGASDVFVRDLQTGVTTLESVKGTGPIQGNAASYSPAISSGGGYLLFRSKANNLASGTFSGGENLFLRYRGAGTNRALTTTGLSAAAMTPDGKFAAYVSSGKLSVWSTLAGKGLFTNTVNTATNVAISADGSRIAYWTGVSPVMLFATNVAGGGSWAVFTNPPASHPGLRFSADNRFLVYSAPLKPTGTVKTNAVFLYDFQAGTNTLISSAYNSALPGNASSDSPDISPDGRFVAYRSAASDLVPNDTNGVPDIFLFDRQTGSNLLLSVGFLGNFSANNRSLTPVFTGDGQTLLFQTSASDAAGSDFNQTCDVLACSVYASGAIPVFSVSMIPGDPGQAPCLVWPVVPEKSYRVQYKSELGDTWLELGSNVTIVGSQGYCQDSGATGGKRFYRIVAE